MNLNLKIVLALFTVSIVLLLVGETPLFGQASANFRLIENTLNSGGNPQAGTVLASSGFKLSVDAIGDTFALTGLSSAFFKMDAGHVAAYPPPGETFNLRFSNSTTLVWDAEKSVGDYNVYRGTLSSLPGGYGTCLQSAIGTQTASDSSIPAPGTAFFYVVTAENRIDEEGTKGFDSSGAERTNPTPCP